MTVQLATGNTGRAVTSASDRRLYAGIFGPDKYVQDIGKQCAASLDGPNKLVVENGSIMLNGAHIDLLGNTEYTIPSGLQGKKRATLCGVYYKAEADGSEDAYEKAYTGDPVDSGNPADPEYPDGNILDNGTTETFMPLYRVITDGINALEPEPLFEVLPSYAKFRDSQSQEIDKMKEADARFVLTGTVQDVAFYGYDDRVAIQVDCKNGKKYTTWLTS